MAVYAVTGASGHVGSCAVQQLLAGQRACGSYRRRGCLSSQEGPGMVSGEPFEGARQPAGKAGPNSSIRLYCQARAGRW